MNTPDNQQLILVTGGAGFIGSNLVDLLLEQGHSVRVLDNLSTGNIANLPKDHPFLEFIDGDIRDKGTVEEACKNVSAVVHLAALVSVPISVAKPDESASINLAGFLNVLDELRRTGSKARFVYASSSAVYGADDKETPLAEEDAPGRLISPYALDKHTNEAYANLYASVYGISTLGLRFFNVYGPRQDPSSDYSGVISIFMDRAASHRPITVYGDGGQTRDFVYVADLADTLSRAIKSDYQGVLNVGTGAKITIMQLAEEVVSLWGSSSTISLAEPREGDIRHSSANASELMKALGYKPDTSLSDGLAKLQTWVKACVE